jgi:hypothetical protein
MINYGKDLCQGNIVIEILADRRKKILVDNTCVKNDGFIPVNFIIPMTVNDVNLFVAFRGVNGLSF